MRLARPRLILFVILALALSAMPALAAAPRTTVTAVENEVMCVSCGVPLAIAESPQADAERAAIKDLVDQGLTKSEVKHQLVEIYGHNVIAKPQSSGFGLAAYLVPIAVVLAVLVALAVALPRWRRRRQQASDDDEAGGAGAAEELSPQDATRLEEDLARFGV
jgi:cytochrome c-type biogenesis protein CcmH/NrfF